MLVKALLDWPLRAVILAQLVERSHMTPEVRSSNPVIDKFNKLTTVLRVCCKDKNKEKEAVNGQFFIHLLCKGGNNYRLASL